MQRLRPHGVTPLSATEYEGRDIYFFDDLELLPRYWQSTNRDNVGELLIAFFHYYHKEFRYAFDVVSIRSEGGILNKVAKGWMNDQSLDSAIDTSGKDNATTTPGQNRNIPRDLNRLCIEVSFVITWLLTDITADDSYIAGSIPNGLQRREDGHSRWTLHSAWTNDLIS